jgi:hypothetical protein
MLNASNVSAGTAASVQALFSVFCSAGRVLSAKMTSEAQNPKIFRQSSQAGDTGSMPFFSGTYVRAAWDDGVVQRHRLVEIAVTSNHLVGRSFSSKGYGLIKIPTIEAY